MKLTTVLRNFFFDEDEIWEEKALSQIRENEGLVLKPYKCPAGRLSIGYGHNLENNGITKSCAEFMLQEDFNSAVKCLEIIFGSDFFHSLKPNKKIALTDMMFNLGATSFLTFKKFIKAIKEKDFERASEEVKLSKAYVQCKNRYEQISKQIKE